MALPTFESPGHVISASAGADLSGSIFRAVKLSSGAFVVAGTGDKADGVLQNKPTSGLTASVMCTGITLAEAEAAISEGVFVAPGVGGTGTFRTAVATDYVVGKALTAASGAGSIFSVLLGIGGSKVA